VLKLREMDIAGATIYRGIIPTWLNQEKARQIKIKLLRKWLQPFLANLPTFP